MGKGFDKFLNMIRLNDDYEDEYDDDDDYDDEFDDDLDDIPAPVVKKKSFKKESKETSETKKETKTSTKKSSGKDKVFRPAPSQKSGSSSSHGKIVPIKTVSPRNEVCVLRPTAFDDARTISDVLLSGRAAVVNLEGIDTSLAQRIIDFISGSCYAMSGHIEKISNFIFIIAPQSIEISGDFEEIISSGIRIPSFGDSSF